MQNPVYRSYLATSAITKNTLVKAGTNDGEVAPCAAATDVPIGVCGNVGQATVGGRVDIIIGGVADLKLGGTVAKGDRITSNASAQGVAAAPAAGTNNGIIGTCEVAGVSGDIVPVNVVPSTFQG